MNPGLYWLPRGWRAAGRSGPEIAVTASLGVRGETALGVGGGDR